METITLNTDQILQLGTGFLVAYLILRLVLDFLKPFAEKQFGFGSNAKTDKVYDGLRNQLADAREEMLGVKEQIRELHVWHNVRNQDGIPVWYVPSSLEKAIQSLAENVSTQTDVLRGVVEMQKDTCKYMERLERRLEKEAR